jgi:DNA-directed RNA polymerase subunit beta'
MSRNMEAILLDEEGRERAKHRIPYGSRLLADDGTEVQQGQTLAEWDPYTIPIITEKKGTANYVDLVDGVSMREVMDEGTGIARSESKGSCS